MADGLYEDEETGARTRGLVSRPAVASTMRQSGEVWFRKDSWSLLMGRSVGMEANDLAEQLGLGLKYLSTGIFELVEGTDIELEVDGDFFKYVG